MGGDCNEVHHYMSTLHIYPIHDGPCQRPRVLVGTSSTRLASSMTPAGTRDQPHGRCPRDARYEYGPSLNTDRGISTPPSKKAPSALSPIGLAYYKVSEPNYDPEHAADYLLLWVTRPTCKLVPYRKLFP